MALVLPILVALLFGSVELGRYFLDEHVVVKAVRDGARYAARQPMSKWVDTGGCMATPDATTTDSVKYLVRTGSVSGTTANRLGYWTTNSTITVTVVCSASAGGQPMTGIYDGITTSGGAAVGAPVVTVSASVPYPALFGLLGIQSGGLSLNASQQAAVTGV